MALSGFSITNVSLVPGSILKKYRGYKIDRLIWPGVKSRVLSPDQNASADSHRTGRPKMTNSQNLHTSNRSSRNVSNVLISKVMGLKKSTSQCLARFSLISFFWTLGPKRGSPYQPRQNYSDTSDHWDMEDIPRTWLNWDAVHVQYSKVNFLKMFRKNAPWSTQTSRICLASIYVC